MIDKVTFQKQLWNMGIVLEELFTNFAEKFSSQNIYFYYQAGSEKFKTSRK